MSVCHKSQLSSALVHAQYILKLLSSLIINYFYILGVELRSSGLETSTLTHGATLQALMHSISFEFALYNSSEGLEHTGSG